MDFLDLTEARLQRRYKRFLADVLLPQTGDIAVVHCPNTGAMTGCQPMGARVWLSFHTNPARKLAWTWELVETDHGLACIHSALANPITAEALHQGVLAELGKRGTRARPEVPLSHHSRADFFIDDDPGIFVEVKSVTLYLGAGEGAFPDAASSRARKHLHDLVARIEQGYRAALVFCVLHEAIKRVSAATSVDPAYAADLQWAMDQGLEVYVLFNDITTTGIYPRYGARLEGESACKTRR